MTLLCCRVTCVVKMSWLCINIIILINNDDTFSIFSLILVITRVKNKGFVVSLCNYYRYFSTVFIIYLFFIYM